IMHGAYATGRAIRIAHVLQENARARRRTTTPPQPCQHAALRIIVISSPPPVLIVFELILGKREHEVGGRHVEECGQPENIKCIKKDSVLIDTAGACQATPADVALVRKLLLGCFGGVPTKRI